MTAGPSHLRLIRGGGGTAAPRIVPAPRHQPPFAVQAVVEEEDTWLVLSAAVEFPARREHPLRLMQALWQAQPLPPGTVVVRAGAPLRMLAVVHDLERRPSWRHAWVSAALDEVLRQAERRGLHSLALPPLGAVHGGLEPDRFMALLRQSLERRPGSGLRRLWLVLPPPEPAGG